MIDVQGCRVLVADDEEGLRFVLRELLTREGFIVSEAEDGQQAVELATKEGFDLYLLDMKMPRMDGLTALKEIRKLYPEALAVMITAYGTQQHAVDALKAGAYDYFTKPFNLEELRLIVNRALGKQALLRKIARLEQQLNAQPHPAAARHGMIGCSRALHEVGDMIDRVAGLDVTVLITGESGTGKEVAAHAIHAGSARNAGPLIKVNCAAIPEPLLESELFGHERGAFTGATHTRPGKFEAANGGTILLDEIGEMPLALQSKLLRVLQERTIERVGSNQPRAVDIRLVAATNRDLAQMVAEKTFREDLYFRINVVPIHLPPLRKRREDLAELTEHFITEFNGRFGKRIRGATPDVMAIFDAYRWPGNVRELQNTIQRAMVMSATDEITAESLPSNLQAVGDTISGADSESNALACVAAGIDAVACGAANGAAYAGNGAHREYDFATPLSDQIERVIESEEIQIIRRALEKMSGHREKTADLLGISRKSLHNKMLKYGLLR